MATSKKAQESKVKASKPEEKKPAAEQLPPAGDDSATGNPPTDQGKTLTIKAVAEAGFYRCGMFFPHEGRTLSVDDLSERQLDQLRAEPNLVVAE